MPQPNRHRSIPRVHAYAASFGEDFARSLIQESTAEGGTVLDPFVGAGTAILESVLSNRNGIGIDIDPIACRISRVLTTRCDVPYFLAAVSSLQEQLRKYEIVLASNPCIYQDLEPGKAFEVCSSVFAIPEEPAIAYWFDPSHMATLSIIRDTVACESDLLVRQAFEVAISSAIIRKWPNTLSFAMDIDHSRPHRPGNPRAKTIGEQFGLFYRVLGQLQNAIVAVQNILASVDSSADILEGDSVNCLATLDSDSVEFVLTSPPYFNAIDYPRSHKFSQWWLSPGTVPLARSEYLGLRQAKAHSGDSDCLFVVPALSEPLAPFRDMPVYRSISRYVLDLAAVVDQLHRIAKPRAKVAFVIANNVIAGMVFPVSLIIEDLLRRNGFSSVVATRRTIKNTRRRYPFGVNGFTGPMKDEYLVTGIKSKK